MLILFDVCGTAAESISEADLAKLLAKRPKTAVGLLYQVQQSHFLKSLLLRRVRSARHQPTSFAAD